MDFGHRVASTPAAYQVQYVLFRSSCLLQKIIGQAERNGVHNYMVYARLTDENFSITSEIPLSYASNQ
jgi:hypothetical protein